MLKPLALGAALFLSVAGPSVAQTQDIPNKAGAGSELSREELLRLLMEKAGESSPPSRAEDDACANPVDQDFCEIQVVAIYEGYTRSGDEFHGDRAKISVDRPGKKVALVLSSYNPVRWDLEVSEDTHIERLILIGHGAAGSRVETMDEVPKPVVKKDISFGHNPRGIEFRRGIQNITKEFGTDRIDGFVGSHSVEAESVLMINSGSQDDPALSTNPLRDAPTVDATSLPPAFQAALGIRSDPTVSFDDSGFTLDYPDGRSVKMKAGLSVPEISIPSNGVYDTKRGLVYGVTLGGEGYIYAGDPRTQTIRVLMSAKHDDFHSIFYDADADRLLLSLPEHRGDSGMEFGIGVLPLVGEEIHIVGFTPSALPGITDTYDVDNSSPPVLRILAASGDAVLVRPVEPFDRGFPMADGIVYALDMRDGSAKIVRMLE